MIAPEPVYLKHMPREVALELDRRYGLVEGSGHVTVLMHDGEGVKFEHRDVGTLREKKQKVGAGG